ncbi:lysine decarboxylase [Limosilactobacillus frumenti DSM 13145]|uniref:Cytokinin riboside 5'-monophosphate phosphoribohydrolase n=1 Tax=Limosilactobacillus frumenti DSM 13145 TaxID=1423746 RepID=A0A0R1P282_9LACO|nr:TIGR00730 family Rossman fold protein [Limosilactobacillus frumenti]KRL26156.1 lysine decarboxylase [Limosilactobacillus frumenti DSM 13145]MBA2913675.1 TIGR00730 family Rossman fold protein [Limosilactobacillus frumenti]QFG73442.1 TIGR00730 family Rossman fold protein [Limosilactobacillus frumenti]
MIKRMAVFCGARKGNQEKYIKQADALGKYMADHDIELVYGGGQFGLMGALADAVLDNGGEVHGVITESLAERGVANPRVKDMRTVAGMNLRKEKMMEKADGMLALPGGVGTLEEISQCTSWMTIGENPKPVAFYNLDGFYDHLRELFVEMNKDGFLEQRFLDAICFSENFDEILSFMNNYKTPEYRKYRN